MKITKYQIQVQFLYCDPQTWAERKINSDDELFTWVKEVKAELDKKSSKITKFSVLNEQNSDFVFDTYLNMYRADGYTLFEEKVEGRVCPICNGVLDVCEDTWKTCDSCLKIHPILHEKEFDRNESQCPMSMMAGWRRTVKEPKKNPKTLKVIK